MERYVRRHFRVRDPRQEIRDLQSFQNMQMTLSQSSRLGETAQHKSNKASGWLNDHGI